VFKNCDFCREVKYYPAQLEYSMVERGIIGAEWKEEIDFSTLF